MLVTNICALCCENGIGAETFFKKEVMFTEKLYLLVFGKYVFEEGGHL